LIIGDIYVRYLEIFKMWLGISPKPHVFLLVEFDLESKQWSYHETHQYNTSQGYYENPQS
jgi:hypothetical protein